MREKLKTHAAKLSAWRDEHHDCDCRAGTSCGCVELREIIQAMEVEAMTDAELSPTTPKPTGTEGGVTEAMVEAAARAIDPAIWEHDAPEIPTRAKVEEFHYRRQASVRTARAALAAALADTKGPTPADIAWLERAKDIGHCGEGTLERSLRSEHNERIDRLLAAARQQGRETGGEPVATQEELRSWQEEIRNWSGSAFLAGEKQSTRAADRDRSSLYAMLCRLGNHVSSWADGAPLYAAPPKTDAPEGLPEDVVRLVIAAREVAFGPNPAAAIDELDQASEAFASRVPWEDEPEDAKPAGGGAE
jgi:hypothetical protein